MILEITEATYLDDYKIKLIFNQKIERLVDLADELHGEIFEPLQDKEYFRSFFIDCGTISWNNGADIAPEYLYFISKSMKEVSSKEEKEIEAMVEELYAFEQVG